MTGEFYINSSCIHVTCSQVLRLLDFPAGENFCQCLLQQRVLNTVFASSVLFTDETNFTSTGILDFEKRHLSAKKNPHIVLQCRRQQQFSIIMWGDTADDVMVCHSVLPQKLTGNSYRHSLENYLQMLLEDLELAIRAQICIIHVTCPIYRLRRPKCAAVKHV
jgi:hypothetical protein